MLKNDPKYELVLNKITLNFSDGKFEEEFRQSYFEKSVQILRVSVFTTILLYAGFGFLDPISSPDYTSEFVFVRFLIVIPVLFLFIGISFLKSFHKLWQTLISFVVILAGSGIIYMLHRDPHNLYYYGGLFLIFMGGYFFLKARFFSASITGIIIVIIYNVAYYIIPVTSSYSVDNVVIANAFFISSNIICMIGLYNTERLERIDFYQQRLLADKQVEIENSNAELENKVKERTKDLMLSKEKAEESERLKSAFLANMSHEIRTPMNGILGFSELLKNPRLTGEEQQHFISIIEKSGARMLSTVNDIVEIAKIEAGQMEVALSTVNIADEMKSLFEFFKQEAEAKGIRISLKMDATKDKCTLITDHNKFSSILSNLIKNAIKYTEEGSIEIECSLKGDAVLYTVRDTGVGIPADRVSAVFNRFEQADISDKKAQQGSGLGLAIAKSYVEMLGGRIWLESRESSEVDGIKSGTVFYFTLPILKDGGEQAKPKTSKKHAQRKSGKYTFLIVEDDAISIQFMNTLLKDSAKALLYAKTGKEAIENVKNNPKIDLVLMDVKMPEMNGYEATKLIKEFKPNLPVIVTTAYAYPDDEKNAIEAGCDGFIAKPITKNALFAVIDEVLNINTLL